MQFIKKFISWALYPATICGGLTLGYSLLYHLNWPLPSVLIPLSISFVLVGLMERILPYRPKWNQSHGDIVADTSYLTVNLALREFGNIAFTLGIVALAAGLGLQSASLGFWPSDWHPLIQVFAALFIFDFFEYWFHRASHRFGFLWRFHAIHHSPKRLYFLNAARFHFVDWIVLTAIEVLILFMIGADPRVIALAVIFIQTHGIFQHGNIDVKLGLLNYIFSGPELHRWHHSKFIHESDTNFGNNVIVWDILFGTYFLPKDRQVGVIGLLNPNFPDSYWGQLKAAFSRTPKDKPADFYGNEAQYEEKIRIENEQELSEIAQTNTHPKSQ